MPDNTLPLRVLICDDDTLTRMVLRRALTKAGHTVVAEAEDADTALQLAQEHQPDLVLMDVTLPGAKNGIAATQELMQIRPLPVIILSAHSDESSVQAALEAGASGYLVKPIAAEQLIAALSMVLARFRTLQYAQGLQSETEEATQIDSLIDKAREALAKQKAVQSEAKNDGEQAGILRAPSVEPLDFKH